MYALKVIPQLDGLDRFEWAFVEARLGALGWEVV